MPRNFLGGPDGSSKNVQCVRATPKQLFCGLLGPKHVAPGGLLSEVYEVLQQGPKKKVLGENRLPKKTTTYVGAHPGPKKQKAGPTGPQKELLGEAPPPKAVWRSNKPLLSQVGFVLLASPRTSIRSPARLVLFVFAWGGGRQNKLFVSFHLALACLDLFGLEPQTVSSCDGRDRLRPVPPHPPSEQERQRAPKKANQNSARGLMTPLVEAALM